MHATTVDPLFTIPQIEEEVNRGALRIWHELRNVDNSLSEEQKALVFLQGYESDFPFTTLVVECALVVGGSNAGAERVFSKEGCLRVDAERRLQFSSWTRSYAFKSKAHPS